MATKPRARTEDEQVALMAHALILAFDILGADTLQRLRIIWRLTDRAFADFEQQVRRELAGEKIPKPPPVSEAAFRAGLRRGFLQIKPKRPTGRVDAIALLEYYRARRLYDSAIVELGIGPVRRRRRGSPKGLRPRTSPQVRKAASKVES